MECKMNREAIAACEELYSGVQEQSVELDYILPDYFPEICKLIQTRAEPEIVAYSVQDGVLSYELCVHVHVLYCSEQGGTVHCVHQKLNYSRTLELGRQSEQVTAELSAKTDYINCRAVNQRRIDLRGAVSVKIRVSGMAKQEAVCDIFGAEAQMRRQPVSYVAKKLHAVRTITISETVELGETKPAALELLRTEVRLTEGETKSIAGKTVAKGEADIRLLYACASGMETMAFNLPFSQILDLEGVDESYLCRVTAELASCEVTPTARNDGEARAFACELQIRLCCTAWKTGTASLVTDVYSTQYPCEPTVSPVKLEQLPVPLAETISEQFSLSSPDSALSQVYDAWCVPKNIGTRMLPETDEAELSGMLGCSVLARDESGMPVMLEQEFPFTRLLPAPAGCIGASVRVQVSACSYTMAAGNAVSVKAELRLTGELRAAVNLPLVTDVTFDGEHPLTHDGDCALKLYYGVEGEAVWDIAKKYMTSISAVMEENELTGEQLARNGMLLIPLVG